MKNYENKQRSAIWLYPSTYEKIDKNLENGDSDNRSQFIENATDFYVGYLNTNNATSYLSEMVQGVIKGTLRSNENRVANNLFRLSVEISVMMNIMAFGLEISEDQLRQTRARCIEEIKRNRGRVALEDAIEHQS
ncbi:MAG: hypothetical protein R3Y35_12855 [Clostridia bacterium]